jgi:hypothetical protein
MAAFTFFHEFKKYLADGTIDLDTHTFKWALTNTAPTAASNTVLADITQITSAGGYAPVTATSVTWTETGAGTGIWAFDTADPVFSASGADFDSARYLVLYDDTPTSPADPLVGYYDYGASFTITNGNSLTLNVSANGHFRLS